MNNWFHLLGENMSTQLEEEKINQSILEHIILGVAHEINNPNAFVRMNAANLKKMINLLRPCFDEYEQNHPDAKFGPYTMSELRSKIHQMIESTIGATVRIITVADKLKQCTSFALSQSHTVSMLEVIKNVVDMHKFLLEKWAKFELVASDGDEYNIVGHKLQLEQGFSILLTNACDAIAERISKEPGHLGQLQIIFKREGQDIHITYKDNGSGIDEEIMDKIFKPYFTTKPQGVGDGMGLPLCQAVVERHYGRMTVKSKKGEGTEMTVILPVKQS